MSNKITKSTAGKFASDLERIYRDADGLSENDKRLIIDSYRKKIPGVANLVDALDQALVDDYISEDEWKDLVGPTLAADGQVLLTALQKKNWRHSWTRYFATNFAGSGRNYFQNPGHAFLLERLAKVDPDSLDPELRQPLVMGLVDVVNGYEKDPQMAVVAMSLLKAWHETSAVNVLGQIVFNMKSVISMRRGLDMSWLEVEVLSQLYGESMGRGFNMPWQQVLELTVHAYDALRNLDPERAESIWSLADIVQGFVEQGDSRSGSSNILTLGQLFQGQGLSPSRGMVEHAIILTIDADTQLAILHASDNAALTRDMTNILITKWSELTPEQREYLLTHPDPVVANGAFEILAGELEKKPQMEMPHGFILAIRNRFLTETDPVWQHRQIEVLAAAIRQDPGLRESLIDRPVHWQLWRVLDNPLDGNTLKDVLFLQENGEVSESNLDFILGLLSRQDESVFLVVRKILLKSRQGLEGRLGALIQEKTGQDPHAVGHALEILALLQEMLGAEALSFQTLESVRAVLLLENSTAREVEAALRVLRLAGTLEADVEASRSAGALRHHSVIASLGQAGYEAGLADLLGQIVRDPKSSLLMVEAAAHALVAMNDEAVTPQLEDIFARQRQEHPPDWMDALMSAVALLGQTQSLDPKILSTLRSRELPSQD